MRSRQRRRTNALLLGVGLCVLMAPPAAQPKDARAGGGEWVPVEIYGNSPIPTVLAYGYRDSSLARGERPAATHGNPWAGRLAALDSAALDAVRGGFEVADTNIRFSFGIERVVFINDRMVASTVLNLKDLQVASGGRGESAIQPGAALEIIKIGPGNGFPIQLAPDLAGTVIQNTLNGQKIQTVTTINAAVNSAELLRALSLQSAIRDGVVGSLRR